MFANTGIDVVVLTRDLSPLSQRVRAAIESQIGVETNRFRVWGRKHDPHEHRVETIARARNLGKKLGESPLIMFVDDDVILADDCCRQLCDFLEANPDYGACGADYARHVSDQGNHVSMGATMFRREALTSITFRFDGVCECLSCCEDLAENNWKIGYCDAARAWHVSRMPRISDRHYVNTRLRGLGSAEAGYGAHVLSAFDRSHWRKWRDGFLESLRRWGNQMPVVAVGYGLPPSVQRRIAQMPNVELICRAANRDHVPVRRLVDFQPIVSSLPPDTPVAYWDAADVIVQSSLDELWCLVRENPDKLLACAEPKWYPENTAVRGWTDTIANPQARQYVFELLSQNPFLNSGFAAATASTMSRYLEFAGSARQAAILAGTADWGDQTVLNLYCHQHRSRWAAIDPAWNYCIHDRPRGEIVVGRDGRIESRRGHRICVAHGNAKSLRQFELRPSGIA